MEFEQIKNKGEKTFADKMEAAGKRLIYQPYLKGIRLRPDFYCIDDGTYYEVFANRQAYHARKEKINNAIKMGIKIKIVNPDGSLYPEPKNAWHYYTCKKCKCVWRNRLGNPLYCNECRKRDLRLKSQTISMEKRERERDENLKKGININQLQTKPCSNCKENPRRIGQRYCLACHANYMYQLRYKQSKEVRNKHKSKQQLF